MGYRDGKFVIDGSEEMRNEYLESQLRQEDSEELNHTYRVEQEYLDLVRQGDVSRIIENNAKQMFPSYPDVVDFNTMKTEEYIAVITVGMVARAAIEAGVTSIESFNLSDMYLRKLAVARDIRRIREIRTEAPVAFATLVLERKSGGRSGLYVEECKKYIVTNIFKKISVRDVAEAMSLNAIYLERVFREATGTTIGDYIRREKIERAKNLLVYSDRSILEIADYLSFSSQSHFGNIFRKETGMTPKQFRMSHRIAGF